jgi:hypothetical protein
MSWIVLLAALCASEPSSWTETTFAGKKILLHPKVQPLSTKFMGPFVTLGDASVLAVDDNRTWTSTDNGKTWKPRPLFAEPDKFQCRGERVIFRTRDGTLLVAFLNVKEMKFRWDQSQGGPAPDCRIPVYVTRSEDDGKTWEAPRKVQDGYCGALRTMIQLPSGRLILACQVAMANPGRSVCFSYSSDDDGKTWKRSNVIDLGKYGGYGDHGGGIEPTLARLHDGRLWMLIRTSQGCFTEAFSDDDGLTWKDIRPSKIDASGSPGQLLRLQSGRLVLFWNRYIDKAKKTGRREQLSMAFSEDDGRSWTDPVVVAYDPMQPGHKEPQHRLSYAYVYERVPGELWVTTFQGPVRVKLLEDDFFPRRLSTQTYPVRYLSAAKIRIDGRADEPEWSQAQVEKGFFFPWKKSPAPATEFRALCDDANLYFSFRIHDDDVFVLDKFCDKMDAVFEDRAELYFSPDDQMKDYYCAEVDPRGRALDYRGAYYRHIDATWSWKGLETAGSLLPQGYQVEGRIPLDSFVALGFPRLRPGVKIRCGLFRAEFSHDRSGKPVVQRETLHNQGRSIEGPPPIEEWMAWVDPKTEDPDFHVPTSLGWLEVVK